MHATPPDPISEAEILVVEDDALSREALADILEAEGYRVVTVVDGREALDRLRGGFRPCVILLDLRMPVMDGATFRRQQLREPELAGIPVVVMTAAGESAQQALAIDAADYFLKPYSASELMQTIARHCGSRPHAA